MALLVCGMPAPARAHAIHSTLTEIACGADGRVTIRIRTFADDFSAAVARYAHGVQRPDFVVADADVARYLGATVMLSVKGGARIPLRFVSQHRTADVVWLELEAAPAALSGARVRNAMLFEIHADQVNIVKATYDRTTFTTLFSSGDKEKALP